MPPEAIKEFTDPKILRDYIKKGSRDEDYPVITQALKHAWDPDDNSVWSDFAGTPAIAWAISYFSSAVEEYKTGNIEPAYYFLGRVAHLPGDMATPAHAHGDVHSLPFTLSHKAKDKDLSGCLTSISSFIS